MRRNVAVLNRSSLLTSFVSVSELLQKVSNPQHMFAELEPDDEGQLPNVPQRIASRLTARAAGGVRGGRGAGSSDTVSCAGALDESNNPLSAPALQHAATGEPVAATPGSGTSTEPWDIMDIMNNVTSVHSCAEHRNQQCGLGAAFDSLHRDKYVCLRHTYTYTRTRARTYS